MGLGSRIPDLSDVESPQIKRSLGFSRHGVASFYSLQDSLFPWAPVSWGSQAAATTRQKFSLQLGW